jgi:hypothetical protein
MMYIDGGRMRFLHREPQREAADRFTANDGVEIVGVFIEVETGKERRTSVQSLPQPGVRPSSLVRVRLSRSWIVDRRGGPPPISTTTV